MALTESQKQELLKLFLNSNQKRRSAPPREPKGFRDTTLGKNIMSRGPLGSILQQRSNDEVKKQDQILMSREYQKVLGQMNKEKELGRGIYRWRDEDWFSHDLDTFEGTNAHEKLIKKAVNNEYYDGTLQFVTDFMTNQLTSDHKDQIKNQERQKSKEESREKWRERRSKAWESGKTGASNTLNLLKDLAKSGYGVSRDEFKKRYQDFKSKREEETSDEKFDPTTDDFSSDAFWKDYQKWNSRQRKDFK
tara:strand:+ start:50 stop:796 length:747 start_codon:yes stop_codon:yes gene_type:complete